MMRIEQVISHYGRQEYKQPIDKRQRHRLFLRSPSPLKGRVDMLSLSPESIDISDKFSDLIAFTRMIPDEKAHEWVKSVFRRPGLEEDGLLDKLIIEIL